MEPQIPHPKPCTLQSLTLTCTDVRAVVVELAYRVDALRHAKKLPQVCTSPYNLRL